MTTLPMIEVKNWRGDLFWFNVDYWQRHLSREGFVETGRTGNIEVEDYIAKSISFYPGSLDRIAKDQLK